MQGPPASRSSGQPCCKKVSSRISAENGLGLQLTFGAWIFFCWSFCSSVFLPLFTSFSSVQLRLRQPCSFAPSRGPSPSRRLLPLFPPTMTSAPVSLCYRLHTLTVLIHSFVSLVGAARTCPPGQYVLSGHCAPNCRRAASLTFSSSV